MPRQIVLDIETTGLDLKAGHRVVEIAAIELQGGRPTGREFYVLLDPERDILPEVTKLNGLTREKLAGKPLFSAIAKELRDFIGSSKVVISCKLEAEGMALDKAFINAEFARAGFAPLPDHQWLNLRHWSAALFGEAKSSLAKVASHYSVILPEKEADKKLTSALDEARVLSIVYNRVSRDYTRLGTAQKAQKLSPQQNPPAV